MAAFIVISSECFKSAIGFIELREETPLRNMQHMHGARNLTNDDAWRWYLSGDMKKYWKKHKYGKNTWDHHLPEIFLKANMEIIWNSIC